jgi:very-short-patch-repair endonuclease
LFEEITDKDHEKQKALEKVGFTVLRFTDNEVLKHIDQVKQNIWNKIEELEANSPPPAPSSGG